MGKRREREAREAIEAGDERFRTHAILALRRPKQIVRRTRVEMPQAMPQLIGIDRDAMHRQDRCKRDQAAIFATICG
jgi:hypothetical protein